MGGLLRDCAASWQRYWRGPPAWVAEHFALPTSLGTVGTVGTVGSSASSAARTGAMSALQICSGRSLHTTIHQRGDCDGYR
jgi:hypothetical protein